VAAWRRRLNTECMNTTLACYATTDNTTRLVRNERILHIYLNVISPAVKSEVAWNCGKQENNIVLSVRVSE